MTFLCQILIFESKSQKELKFEKSTKNLDFEPGNKLVHYTCVKIDGESISDTFRVIATVFSFQNDIFVY